jgi:hypothetical protein
LKSANYFISQLSCFKHKYEGSIYILKNIKIWVVCNSIPEKHKNRSKINPIFFFYEEVKSYCTADRSHLRSKNPKIYIYHLHNFLKTEKLKKKKILGREFFFETAAKRVKNMAKRAKRHELFKKKIKKYDKDNKN